MIRLGMILAAVVALAMSIALLVQSRDIGARRDLGVRLGAIVGWPEQHPDDTGRVLDGTIGALEGYGMHVATAGEPAYTLDVFAIFAATPHGTQAGVFWVLRGPEGQRLGQVHQRNQCPPDVAHEACVAGLMAELAQTGPDVAAHLRLLTKGP